MALASVRRILRGQRDDVFRIRTNSLQPWLAKLDAEWAAGCRNGAELWRRFRIADFGARLRARQRRAEAAPLGGPRRCPSAREIARMMTAARDHLSKEEALTVATIEAAVPRLAAACALIDRFHAMVQRGDVAALRPWLENAAASLLASFANGLRGDEEAVTAALAESWSNGQTEGNITKLKFVISHLTRSSLHRCFRRQGISRLPVVEGSKPREAFKAQAKHLSSVVCAGSNAGCQCAGHITSEPSGPGAIRKSPPIHTPT